MERFGRPLTGTLVGIGIDSVDLPRFAAVLERRPSIAARVFTAGERDFASGISNPVPSLAARFAVKEAVMKALGVGIGSIDWTDVEVRRQRGDAPTVAVSGRAAALAEAQGVTGWKVSITHTDTVASAVVAAVR
jgi:holo-[acyl-carrier protein] synthase